MARPRTPTNVLDARGAFDKNPDRKRPKEPKAKSLGRVPNWFCDEKRKIWHEIVKACADGVFQSSDRISLEMIVNLLHRYRTNPDRMAITAQQALFTWMGRFGMNASERSKIMIPNQKKDDEWDDL